MRSRRCFDQVLCRVYADNSAAKGKRDSNNKGGTQHSYNYNLGMESYAWKKETRRNEESVCEKARESQRGVFATHQAQSSACATQ